MANESQISVFTPHQRYEICQESIKNSPKLNIFYEFTHKPEKHGVVGVLSSCKQTEGISERFINNTPIQLHI